uniref:Uncharacterized protein n=1 Tax=Anguilla anguilla TaxID=7936 RepID=A0A0E9UUF2_ANGAN
MFSQMKFNSSVEKYRTSWPLFSSLIQMDPSSEFCQSGCRSNGAWDSTEWNSVAWDTWLSFKNPLQELVTAAIETEQYNPDALRGGQLMCS